jgi:glycosyltransferase involved in cell wall biosynthesis
VTSALVVSRSFPDGAEKVHGIYQRLGIQVQALARAVGHVHCLFLVKHGYPADVIRAHEERLRRLWSPAISIQIEPTVDGNVPGSWWQLLRQGVFDFQRQAVARYSSTQAAVAAVSAALDARPDVVLAHRLTSMCVFMKIALESPERAQGIPIFLDMDDIEHVTLVRRLLSDPAWPAERLLLMQVPALMLGEIKAVRLAAATFVCSEADRRSLARLSRRSSRVRVIPNSVTFPRLADADVSEQLVLFVGAMDYRPNAQAADSLVREVWPAIQARVPEAQLAIVGPGREHSAAWRSTDRNVTFTGFVDNLEFWYRRARVVCCPIYHGGGTRVKIIEAAAHAKAIVSTRLGAEGLNFQREREIILRDSPAELAAACVQLLNDRHAAARLGQAALQRAHAVYGRSAVVEQLATVFRAACADGVRQRVPG